MLAAQKPSKPNPPTTILNGYNVVISWTEPFNGGSPTTGYKIYLRKNDGVSFIQDFTHCDGSKPEIIAARSCSIPSNQFVSTLYGLYWGQEVYAKIVSFNLYGISQESLISNPTILMRNPDAPVDLTENTSLRSFT